ncbi:MAG TPA: translation elongation factor Ts [Polyangiaceae bacterium]|jgi:elongation factor Ts
MADITAGMVKELRERTQAGMSDCKNALVEAGGDMDKAVDIILKKGIVKAASRAGRVATEGEVRTSVSADGKHGTIVEVNCQTDFVARGDDFRGFVHGVLETAKTLQKGADLGTHKFHGSDKTVETVRAEIVAKTGENTVVRRWAHVEASGPNALVHAYIHMGGKLAVLVEAEGPNAAALGNHDFKTFVDNVAMQIAAMNPLAVRREEIAKGDADKQREILTAQFKEEQDALAPEKRKPEAMWGKIVDGKVSKWFDEVTLLGQDSVTDPGKTVEAVRKEVSSKVGGDVKLLSFVRFSLGEGIEKKTDDLAAEVAKMTAG